MDQFFYDGTFAGLLSTIFEIYERKSKNVLIVSISRTEAMVFNDNICIITDHKKADRVWKALEKKFSADTLKNIYWSYLSELKGIENTIYDFIKYAFESDDNIEKNYGHSAVIEITKTAKKVGREKHRMEAFVRFELISETMFYAPIDPDFNVLPLIVKHFKSRYANQDWIIYDTKRKFGMHYDKITEEVNEIIFDFNLNADYKQTDAISFDPQENRYRDLWRTYFKSVNILIRKNTKLHVQHVPKRYWKYLVEKK